jgi:hypothetical protein
LKSVSSKFFALKKLLPNLYKTKEKCTAVPMTAKMNTKIPKIRPALALLVQK